ncbi:MAG: sulfatase-like hydrolase/transferase [Porticoccaceae bacterium]
MTRSTSPALPWLPAFALLSWAHMLVLTRGLAQPAIAAPALDWPTVFHLCAWLVYSLLYLSPALLATGLAARFLPGAPRFVALLALATSLVCLLFIHADGMIHQLYNFHINGFVLNLLVTPGGIESLGTGSETYLSIALMVGRILVIQTLVLALSRALAKRQALPRGALAAFAGVWLGCLVLQGFAYGLADLHRDGDIMDSARAYPFFQRVRFRTLAARFGVEAAPRPALRVAADTARLAYPRRPVTFEAVAKPPNIVWLVAESLRWDQLDPRVMPNTWAFARRAQHFTRHYSTGNGTRESLFGMFYGLYGSYWESFLTARRSPLLMDRIAALGYQLDLRTSAAFTYPEFDKTLFAGVPAAALVEADGSLPPWRRDEVNTAGLIDFLKQRDTQRPFMGFYFLESTHARYSFPEDRALIRPYAEDVNYARMDKDYLRPRIDLIKHRYANAAHWVDVQVGRIVAELERQDLLDNTIVIITGDHGEEFLEKGSWGHNSHFVDEQTRVPLVVWMPGRPAAAIDRLTSHKDIATTLLQTLGASGPVENYSLGQNLFDASPRPFIVVSDWHSIGVITPDLKFRIPYLNRGNGGWDPTGPGDETLGEAEGEDRVAANQRLILSAISNSSRFLKTARPAVEKAGALAL